MKVAFVSQPFDFVVPPRQSSIGICTYELARHLVKYCIVIVYAMGHSFTKKTEIFERVHYRYIGASPDNLLLKIIRIFSRFHMVKQPLFTSSLYYFMYALQVAKDLRSQQCDIAHVQTFPQFVPFIRAFNPRIKIVLHNHGEWLTQLDRETINRQLREVDLVIGCSEYITEKIRCAFPQFAKRCQTIYNGVDVNRFFSIKSRKIEKNGIRRVLSVGRISPEKGLHTLLDAFKKVVERYPKAQLTIVGLNTPFSLAALRFRSSDRKIFKSLTSFYNKNSRCNYFPYLQEQLFSLNISNNVTFTGYVPHLQIVDHYRNNDVFVNSSFSESFGIPTIEAMATEVPVVATRAGGTIEIVEDGKTGILVKPADAESLAQAILRLLSDEDLAKSMGKAGRKRAVELFSWEKIVEKLLFQYKRLLGHQA